MRAAVLGKPIAHSLSPVIHRAGYLAQNLAHSYEAVEIDTDQLGSFIAGCGEDWMGVSLTMPLKVAAFGVADQLTPLAEITGTINTLVFGEQIIGYNTDVYGLVQACVESGVEGIETCSIIGSGATARSALVAARELGGQHVRLLARNSVAIAQCAQIAGQLGINITVSDSADADFENVDLVINTTPVGVADKLLADTTEVSGLLLDVVYSPWPTQLASRWIECGGTVCPGYLMLLHQAAAQYDLFTGLAAPLDQMRAALMETLRN